MTSTNEKNHPIILMELTETADETIASDGFATSYTLDQQDLGCSLFWTVSSTLNKLIQEQYKFSGGHDGINEQKYNSCVSGLWREMLAECYLD